MSEDPNVEAALKERVLTKLTPNEEIAPGFKGGFEQSNPKFSYPVPDVTSEEINKNLDHIPLLQRQIRVLWPEFSWTCVQGDEETRCFQMFAPDISRLGYTDEGKVYSVICPQQGVHTEKFGNINVEVTVTGNRGWVNENNDESTRLAGQVGVVGSIWFSDTKKEFKLLKQLEKYAERHFKEQGYNFPSSKEHAIQVETFAVGEPENPWFYFLTGLSDRFEAPSWTTHEELSYQNANLSVQIGKPKPTGDAELDKFNQTIVNFFNVGVKNMLQEGNVLTWNMWFDAPHKVDTKEWEDHAEFWRTSIDVGHGNPEGNSSQIRNKNAEIVTEEMFLIEEAEEPFKQLEKWAEQEIEEIEKKCNCVIN